MEGGGETDHILAVLKIEKSSPEAEMLNQLMGRLSKGSVLTCDLLDGFTGVDQSQAKARILLWRLLEQKFIKIDGGRRITVSDEMPSIPALSARPDRDDRYHRQPKKKDDERDDAERDRDRILFSSAFRRLAGVTQVVAPTESQPIHNRLTHSLKVAQIGRGLANTLLDDEESKPYVEDAGGLDPFVVEAAGLAHDLGHPPFGHIAESELNRLVSPLTPKEEGDEPNTGCDVFSHFPRRDDGFEGNAQSFRIITTLTSRFHDLEGLDLTRATLCAVLKYPWLRNTSGTPVDSSEKWGAYESEKELLAWARELSSPPGFYRSLEAALMDWADDIAYAVHDLEDFYRAALIPLDRLASSQSERTDFLNSEFGRRTRKKIEPLISREDLEDSFQRLMCIAPFSRPFAGTRRERAVLRSFTSTLISNYMHAISLTSSEWGERALDIPDWARVEVETLKGLTWHYVINSQALSSQRSGQRNVIRFLYEVYGNAALSTDPLEWNIFPAYFQEKLRVAGGLPQIEVPRMVADVIASMSEVQAIETFQRLSGLSFGSALIRPSI